MTGMIETPVATVANAAATKTESAPEQVRVQRDRAAKPCDPTSRAGARQAYQVYSSRQLFGATREIGIRHGDFVYKLRITRQGKLLLNK